MTNEFPLISNRNQINLYTARGAAAQSKAVEAQAIVIVKIITTYI